MVRTKTNRAEILRSLVSLDLAFEDLMAIQDLVEVMEPSLIQSFYYNRLAAIEFERKNYQATLNAVKKSQDYKGSDAPDWLKYSNLNLLGAVYRDQEIWEKSVQVLNETYQLSQSLDDKAEMYLALKNLGMTYYRMGNFRSAVETFKLYRSNKFISVDRQNISENFRLLARSYQQLEMLDSAYVFLDSSHQHTLLGMQDIVDKRTDDYRISNELVKQKLENSILIAEGEKSQLRIIMLLAVLIFIVIIAAVLFRQKQDYRKLNTKQQELNKELEASLLFKNKLIAIVAHDIRNPMTSLTGVIHLYNEGFIDKGDLKDMMAKLEASAVSVNFLIENLLNWVLNQKETLKSIMTPIKLSQLIEKSTKEVESQLRSRNLSLQVYGFESDLTLNTDESMLALVIRNVLSNAIKFSKENSAVIVSYKQESSQHLIMIKDFGIGMTKDNLTKLNTGPGDIQYGTNNEKGTGLGLALSKEFLIAIGATLKINSEKGKGTEVCISIPF